MMHPSHYGRLFATALPISLILLGAWLRLSSLAREQQLHPDEALYADLARRIGIWGDWQLLNIPVDKPPLQYFINGWFYALLGDSELSTRLPNAFAGIISIALFYIISKKLLRTPSLATLLFVVSPLHIGFSVTNFTDMQMLTWTLAALAGVLYQRWGLAGVAFGCAIITKPAALWSAPLLLFFCIGQPLPTPQNIFKVVMLVALPIITASIWDQMGSIGSFWALGAQNYDGNRLIRPDEVIPRAQTWLDWLAYLTPHILILLFGFVLGVAYLWKQRSQQKLIYFRYWGLVGFCIVYLGIQWLVAFNIYDRYLLIILPASILFVSLGLTAFLPAKWHIGIIGLILVLGTPLGWQTSQGQTPIAHDNDRAQGVAQLAEVMNTQFAGEIFYEHSLGWELRYYLSAEPHVILLYFATPDAMIDYALQDLSTIQTSRYFVAPKTETAPWIALAQARGIQTEVIYYDDSFTIIALSMP